MPDQIKGLSAAQARMRRLPDQIKELLRGAAKAGAKVVKDEIAANAPSVVAEGLRVRSKIESDRVTVRIDVKPGWPRSVATWNEYGTSPHFISVDKEQRRGRSVGRINQQVREADGAASLVIGGKFVGKTVWHPGTYSRPVFRPAADLKAAEAKAAAQAYVNAHVSRHGITPSADDGDD